MKHIIVMMGLGSMILLFGQSLAFGCQGKQVLFEDNFTQLDPAYNVDPAIAGVQNGKLIVRPFENKSYAILYQGDIFDDVDFCVKIRQVKSDDPSQPAGLAFWGKDHSSYYVFQVALGKGQFGVSRWVNRWITPLPWQDGGEIMKGMGEVNELRVVLKGNQATLYVNGQQVGTIKGQPAEGGSLIGINAESPESSRAVWEFSELRVTK